MKRTLVVLGLMAAGLVRFGPDLVACGDKSFSSGGIRMQRALAARYPASILIYTKPGSRIVAAARELKLQETLLQVGHKYREVSTSTELDAALESRQFNVVVTDISELPDLQRRVESSPSRPVLVPIAYKLTKTEASDAARQARFLIKAPSRAAQYLDTITDAVRAQTSATRKG